MSNVSSIDIQKARRNALRTRASAACASCKTAKMKCSDFRPCKRCANTRSRCMEAVGQGPQVRSSDSHLNDKPKNQYRPLIDRPGSDCREGHDFSSSLLEPERIFASNQRPSRSLAAVPAVSMYHEVLPALNAAASDISLEMNPRAMALFSETSYNHMTGPLDMLPPSQAFAPFYGQRETFSYQQLVRCDILPGFNTNLRASR
jgi:hypothetical protein